MLRSLAARTRSAIAKELQDIAYEDPWSMMGPGKPRRYFLIPFLGLASLFVRAAAKARQQLYEVGLLQQTRLPVPVISVGNLTWGGNGKTPMAEFVARRCWDLHGVVPLVLSRGYQGGDEARMMRRRMMEAGAPALVGVGPDRAEVAQKMLRDHPEIGVVVLDDGLQHLKLARDLEICMVNALRPFGNGYGIPLGALRECPGYGLPRCHVIVVHHAELQHPPRLAELEVELRTACGPSVVMMRSSMEPKACRSLERNQEEQRQFIAATAEWQQKLEAPSNTSDSLASEREDTSPRQVAGIGSRGQHQRECASGVAVLKGAHVVCLTGIGCPQALEAHLLKCGAVAVEGIGQLGDHEEASEALLGAVRRRVSSLQSGGGRNPVVLLTEKDLDRDVSGTVREGLEGLAAYVLEGQFKVSRMQELDKQIFRVLSYVRPRPTDDYKTRQQSR